MGWRAFRLPVVGEVLLLVGALAGTIWATCPPTKPNMPGLQWWWQRWVQGLLGGVAGALEPQRWRAYWLRQEGWWGTIGRRGRGLGRTVWWWLVATCGASSCTVGWRSRGARAKMLGGRPGKGFHPKGLGGWPWFGWGGVVGILVCQGGLRGQWALAAREGVPGFRPKRPLQEFPSWAAGRPQGSRLGFCHCWVGCARGCRGGVPEDRTRASPYVARPLRRHHRGKHRGFPLPEAGNGRPGLQRVAPGKTVRAWGGRPARHPRPVGWRGVCWCCATRMWRVGCRKVGRMAGIGSLQARRGGLEACSCGRWCRRHQSHRPTGWCG